jgi:hypothetical protein
MPSTRERRVARVVAYEIAESVRFEPVPGDPHAWVRQADATIFGKEVVAAAPDPAFVAGTLLVARAASAVLVPGHAGPIVCTFELLCDSAPDRPSLDKLVVTAAGTLEGRIDLANVHAGWATAEGAWRLESRSGRFSAAFFVPMKPRDGEEYAYAGHDDDGQPLAAARDRRAVRDDERVLGFPATKIVLSVFEPVTTAS